MSIETIMTRKVATVRPDDLLGTAAQVMLWSGGRHLPVMDDGQLVGILSEGDLFRARSKAEGEQPTLVREAMTSPVKTAKPSERVATAAGRMAADKFACLPVVDDGKLVGILTTTDVLSALEGQELSRKKSSFQEQVGVEVLSFRVLSDGARRFIRKVRRRAEKMFR